MFPHRVRDNIVSCLSVAVMVYLLPVAFSTHQLALLLSALYSFISSFSRPYLAPMFPNIYACVDKPQFEPMWCVCLMFLPFVAFSSHRQHDKNMVCRIIGASQFRSVPHVGKGDRCFHLPYA